MTTYWNVSTVLDHNMPHGMVFIARHPDTMAAYGLGATRADACEVADARLRSGDGPIRLVNEAVASFIRMASNAQ